MNRRDFFKTCSVLSISGLVALDYPYCLAREDGSLLISVHAVTIESFEIPNVVTMHRYVDIEYFSENGKQIFIPYYLREYALESNVKLIHLYVRKVIGIEKINLSIW